MAVFERLNRAFQKRRKRNSNSRRWAIRATKTKTSVLLTPDNPVNIKLNRNDKTVTTSVAETGSEDDKQLSSSPKCVVFCTISNIMQQCQRVASQFWTGFWNHFLFWRSYVQRVEMLHRKVDDLQREICLLRSSVQMADGPRSSNCHCGKPEGVSVLQPIAVAPALPPAPPPPPPPPPPPATMPAPQKLSLIAKKRTTHSTFQEKVDQRAAVTLQDLQAVQLKKVTVNQKVRSPNGRRSALVTLADLQKIRLRRTQCSLPSPLRPRLGRAPIKSPVRLQVQLKKVHINRSPGGTPMCNKENVHSCVSAIMNQALY